MQRHPSMKQLTRRMPACHRCHNQHRFSSGESCGYERVGLHPAIRCDVSTRCLYLILFGDIHRCSKVVQHIESHWSRRRFTLFNPTDSSNANVSPGIAFESNSSNTSNVPR